MNKTLLACALALSACTQSTSPAVSPPPPEGIPPVSELVATPPMGDVVEEVTEPPEVPPAVDPLALVHIHPTGAKHIARSFELKSFGDLDGALAEARRALFDDPTDEDATTMITRIARQTEDWPLLLTALDRLSSQRPTDPHPAIQAARIFLNLGEPHRAFELGEEALLRDPQHPEAYQILGRAHLSQGELDGAIGMFKKVLELSPEHGYALNNLGFAYLRANQNLEAVEVLGRAAELLPDIAFVHNNLGIALERTGRTSDAQASFEKSQALSPKYLKAKLNSARLAKLSDVEALLEH
jgi:tetratricopeptide (TPR) repeat protein